MMLRANLYTEPEPVVCLSPGRSMPECVRMWQAYRRVPSTGAMELIEEGGIPLVDPTRSFALRALMLSAVQQFLDTDCMVTGPLLAAHDVTSLALGYVRGNDGGLLLYIYEQGHSSVKSVRRWGIRTFRRSLKLAEEQRNKATTIPVAT